MKTRIQPPTALVKDVLYLSKSAYLADRQGRKRKKEEKSKGGKLANVCDFTQECTRNSHILAHTFLVPLLCSKLVFLYLANKIEKDHTEIDFLFFCFLPFLLHTFIIPDAGRNCINT